VVAEIQQNKTSPLLRSATNFADNQKTIVKIHSFTVPYAIDSYPSERAAQYVVEVNGRCCEKYGLKEGDQLTFTLPKQ
jgi:uncharacterized membrane protein (UPF0127 family)